MIQCQDCEHFGRDDMGRPRLGCNPFGNVKEPECVQKWLLLKLDTLVRSYQATLVQYQRFAPLQEKMLRHLERELDDMEDSDRWKRSGADDPTEDDWNYRPDDESPPPEQ